MNSAKVSVIIPVYNCEQFVEKCISSVLLQEYRYIEIIIVDDGSTDGSGEIIDTFAQKDERIIAIHKKNEGVSAARNDAIKLATGKYLLFVDGDDYIDKDFIVELVECAETHNSELVVCGYVMENMNGKVMGKTVPTSYSRHDEAWVYRISAVCSRLYSRAFWDRMGMEYTLEKNARGEDVPISMLANYCARNISVIDCAGYHYVQHANSAMHNSKGMVHFRFPRKAMVDAAHKANNAKVHNSRAFFEFGILKMFAQFDLVISRGMNKREKQKLIAFFNSFFKEYLPNYGDSWREVKKKSKNIPIFIKLAIDIFCIKMELLNCIGRKEK